MNIVLVCSVELFLCVGQCPIDIKSCDIGMGLDVGNVIIERVILGLKGYLSFGREGGEREQQQPKGGGKSKQPKKTKAALTQNDRNTLLPWDAAAPTKDPL